MVGELDGWKVRWLESWMVGKLGGWMEGSGQPSFFLSAATSLQNDIAMKEKGR